MLQRDALERRIYRLATLLTGNPNAATTVIEQVLHSGHNLAQFDSPHLDRLTVLRSRELAVPGAVLADDSIPRQAAEVLAALEPQQREAWVFHRIYCLPIREASKAMDCSTAAVQRHFEQAEASMARQLGETGAADAASAFRDYSLSVNVPQFYHEELKLRRRRRWLAIVVIVVFVLALGVIAVRLLLSNN
jgi:hypothetical protein